MSYPEPEVFYDGQSMNAASIRRPPNDLPVTLVLCLDGTQNEFGYLPFSNSLKFFRLLDKDSPRQLCYYQPGVGVKFGTAFIDNDPKNIIGRNLNKLNRQLDSVFAFSFQTHVRAAYIFLMRFYRENDRICLIGFSRGSFAARILVGMLESVGLLNSGLEDMVPTAWDIYSNWENAGQPTQEDYSSSLVNEFKNTFCRSKVKIHFMGLFDSVNSVGLIRDRMFPFTSRSAIVDHVRHAVSLDERRGKFKQVLFQPYSYYPHLTDLDYDDDCNEEVDGGQEDTTSLFTRGISYLDMFTSYINNILGRRPKKRIDDDCHCQDIKEVVFPGNHGDVGGGWQDDNTDQCLSNIPLRWMLSQAIKYDIKFKRGAIHQFDSSFPVISSFLAFNHDMLSFSSQKKTTSTDANVSRIVLPEHQICGNNKSGKSSFIQILFWWAIELLPIGIKIEDENGQWKRIYIPNLGRPRKLPPNISLHWSVFYRLHYFQDYSPMNLPTENLGRKFHDLMIKPFQTKFKVELENYQELTVDKIKTDWDNDIWKTLPDELEEILAKNPSI